MFSRFLLLGTFLAGSSLSPPLQATQALSQGIRAGPFAVGVKALCFFDASRSFPNSQSSPGFSARPLRIIVWYPSQKGHQYPATFADLLGLRCADSRLAPYEESLAARDLDTAKRQLSPPPGEVPGALAGASTTALLNGPNAEGRFPLVVHSLGQNDYQLESTVLWEQLASQGFVVAVVPQMGMDSSERLEFTPAALELQATDLAFTIGQLATLPNVDPSHIGLVGHSFGAAASLLLASRNSNIGAIASLEGAETSGDGPATMAAANWAPWAIRAPVLELYAVGPDKNFDAVDGLAHSQVYRVGLGSGLKPTRATHFDLQNWPIYSGLVGTDDPRGLAFRPSELGATFYLAAVQITCAFFEGNLRGNAESLDVVTGRAKLQIVPEGLIRYQ